MPDASKAVQDAIVAVTPVALVYFSGWSYLSSYLNAFGIDPTQVEMPLTTVLVYAFRPLGSAWVWVPLIILACCFQLTRLNHFAAKLTRSLAYPLLVSAAIGLLFWVNSVATTQANELAVSVWHGHRARTVAWVSMTKSDIDKDYALCMMGKRIVQIIGFPSETYLLCRSELLPCTRGALFVVKADGQIRSKTEIARKPVLEEEACDKLW